MEKPTKPSSSNENDNSKKYKFYRRPSIKKKGPEVKHTKTSLARILKANPLLKFEISTKHEPPSNPEIKLGPVNTKAPKMSISNISGNGPYSKPRIIRCRFSSSDFVDPISSSTLIESDDVFNGQSSQAPIKSLPKITNKNEENLNNILINKKNEKRKSLSSQYLHRKKKEFQEITKKENVSTGFSKQGVMPLRRSLSADNAKVCYRIEEEDSLLESKSTQSLSQEKESDEIATSTVLTAITWEDLKTRLDKPSVKQTTIPSNGELYDEENKENIEVSILESDSYEDLKICNGDVLI